MAQQTIQIADKPTLDKLKASIDNATYGLQALKGLIDLNAKETSVDEVESLLKNSTYGLSAIKTKLNSVGGGIKSVQRGLVKEGASATGYGSIICFSMYDRDVYLDVSISPVNTSKSFILVDKNESIAGYLGVSAVPYFISSTQVRFILAQMSESEAAKYASVGYNCSKGFSWQVIEFY